MPQLVVYLGPARSGKTHDLLRQYRDALQQRPGTALDRTLWLAPNSRAAALVRHQLVEGGLDACLRPGVVTFDQLTADVLADAKLRVNAIAQPLERELSRRVVHRALEDGGLTFFAAAARRAAFIDLLADHIRELKRRDIEPDAYAKARPPRGDQQQHNELASLYAEYERQLAEHGLADTESAHTLARDALAARTCPRFQNLELIVVDGFTDFTATQHGILRLLAQRTKQLLISLPADGSTEAMARSDLFAKSAATLAELRRLHPQLETRQLLPRSAGWAALEHVVQHIFRQPAHVQAPSAEALDSLDRLEIVESAGAHDEIVQIARRIKRRLTTIPLPLSEGLGEGSSASPPNASPNLSPQGRGAAKPGDIVVVFRSLADVAPRVREVFDQFGIPYSLETHERIVSAPVVKTLLALLRLHLEDWPFRRVIATLTNNTLTAIDDGARQAADWLVRDLQIAEARGTLLERVEQLAADRSQPAERGEHLARRVAAATTALPAFRLLAAALDSLPNEASLTEWCDALARLGTQLALGPFIRRTDNPVRPFDQGQQDGQDCPSYDATDLIAWQSIVKHFAQLERLDGWLGEPPRKLSQRELLSTLLNVATNESLPQPHDDVGRVRVMAAPHARTVPAKHLYLAGMSEQAFPSPERAGRLATEADYRYAARVADQDLAAREGEAPAEPLCARTRLGGSLALPSLEAHFASRSQEEMLLFYEVLSRAEESLTISYPALDERAQTLPSSPYVLEIERSLGESNKERLRRARPQLSPVPQEATPYSRGESRIRAVANAIEKEGDRHLLAGIFSSAADKRLGDAIDAGVRIVHSRARGDSFGPAEGVLTSPAALERLAQRFGPQHLWSPSQWESYAACPYKFFLQHVLGLAPLGDLVLETDFARRGSRLHHVLATFHRQWHQMHGERSLSAEEEATQFLDHLRNVIDERIAPTPRGGIDAALVELDRRQIREWTKGHFDQHAKYDNACSKLGGQLKPTHFELRFGPPRPGEADNDPNSTREAFVIEIGGEQIRVTGQIDRIDVGTVDGKTVFSVIDYKSGKKPSLKDAQIASGEQLQLPIYVAAAQALVFGGNATPLAAGYWSMAGGFDAKGALAVRQEGDHDARWKKIRDTIEARIAQFVADIRHGAFPVASRDDKCTSRCEFNTVCRVTQIRSLGKTWPPGVESQESRVESQKAPSP